MAATVFGEAGVKAKVVLAEAEAAVTPGQACVFYDGERVFGGVAIITASISELSANAL